MAEGTPRDTTENLIPFDKRSEAEARALGAKGGIRSGEVRREKKRMREILREYLETRMVGEKTMMAAICERYAEHILEDAIAEAPTLLNQLEGTPKQEVIVSEADMPPVLLAPPEGGE